MKRAIFAVMVSVTVLAFGLVSSGPSQVHALSAVQMTNGKYRFRLSANTHYCIINPQLNHRYDQQLTIGRSGGCATITVKSVPHSRGDKFLSVDGGHCLYKTVTGTDVKVSRNVCATSNQDESWTPTASFPFRFMNDGATNGGWMRVRWITPGSRVTVGNRGHNNWTLVQAPTSVPTVR